MKSIKLNSLTVSAVCVTLALGLSSCNAQPTLLHVEATQGFCDSGFDAWDKPTCSGEMQDAGIIDFTLDTTLNQVTAKLIKPNPFAQRVLLTTFNQCKITDALNWYCEEKDAHYLNVKEGHYHYYTLNKDLTLSHFIGHVIEKPIISK